MNEVKDDDNELFSIFAEVGEYPKPLIMTDLRFARLIDEVVVPYQKGEPFFIDGVPAQKDNLKKLKIVRQQPFFKRTLDDLHQGMWQGALERQKVFAEQYHTRLEALLREAGEDVTSQVIKAFDTTIKPELKDYLPNRKELIEGAWKAFIETMKMLGGN